MMKTESKPKYVQVELPSGAIAPIGQCTIVAINIYNTRKLRVEFISDKRDGSGTEVKREWVDHKTCSKWAERVEIVHNAH